MWQTVTFVIAIYSKEKGPLTSIAISMDYFKEVNKRIEK